MRLWQRVTGVARRRRLSLLATSAVVIAMHPSDARAQTAPATTPATGAAKIKSKSLTTVALPQLSPAQLSLDEWVVRRFRNAELLPDSVVSVQATSRTASAPSALTSRTGTPIIDGLRSAEHRDTVVALHFDTAQSKPALNTASTVRFVDPSGEISPITGRVTARRSFRAPRTANPRASNAQDWRVGWAYLVALPPKTATAASNGMNGWSLVEAPSPNTKRANN